MTIKIIEEPDIHLTQEQHARLLAEYKAAMSYYAGPPIPFEAWVRNKLKKDARP